MTFSILARHAETGEFGAGVATGLPAVGGFVLHLRAGAGAIATQGYATNTLYGPRGLRLLEDGSSADETCKMLIGEDEGRHFRQLIVLDEAGRSAGWTGNDNIDRKLHICLPELALAGNWIASDAVVHAMRRGYADSANRPMIERMIAALAAGEAAGSDSRGLRSAAVSVVSRDGPPLELRVDLDDRPIEGLLKVHRAVCHAEFRDFLRRLPTLDDPMRR